MANLSSIKLHLALEEKEEEFRLAVQYLERVEEKGDEAPPLLPKEFHSLRELHKLFPIIEVGNGIFVGAP